MKIINRFLPGLALWGAALLGTTTGVTAVAQIKLPPEVAKLRTSSLPGYAIAMQKCAICHSADYVNYQPPGMTQAQWTAEMAKMQHAYGAPISDDEVKQIGAYLAVAYGSAKATDPAVLAVAAPPAVATTPPSAVPVAAPTTAAATGELMALLNSNACLSCHAIAQKIVGPAYQDVAAKYKGDGQAVAKLEASIRNGSVGKWGAAPMPPFPALSEAQLKALAEFVLKQ